MSVTVRYTFTTFWETFNRFHSAASTSPMKESWTHYTTTGRSPSYTNAWIWFVNQHFNSNGVVGVEIRDAADPKVDDELDYIDVVFPDEETITYASLIWG